MHVTCTMFNSKAMDLLNSLRSHQHSQPSSKNQLSIHIKYVDWLMSHTCISTNQRPYSRRVLDVLGGNKTHPRHNAHTHCKQIWRVSDEKCLNTSPDILLNAHPSSVKHITSTQHCTGIKNNLLFRCVQLRFIYMYFIYLNLPGLAFW